MSGVGTSSVLVLSSLEQQPRADDSRFCLDNVFARGTLAATDNAADLPLAFNGNSYDAWASSGAQSITVTLPDAEEVDYLALYGQGVGGATISVEYKAGGSWVELVPEFIPGPRRVVAVLFDPVFSAEFRFNINAAAYAIGDLRIGRALPIPGGMRPGFAPARHNEEVEYTTSRTVGGHIVGHSIKRRGAVQPVRAEHLSELWIRTAWQPFADLAHEQPLYFIWSPERFGYEVIFGVIEGRPQVAYSSTVFMTVDVTLRGLL